MIRINLLKPETRDIGEATPPGTPEFKPPKKPTNVGNLVFLLLVVGLGAFYFLQQRAFNRENELLDQAQREKAKLQYVIAKLEEVKLQKANLERKINLINNLKAQQDLAVRLMDDLSRYLPEWVWLTEVTFDPKGLLIKGKALSNNLIADYIAALEASPNLRNVSIISSVQKDTRRDQYLEFNLNAAVELPVTAPEKPAAKPAGAAAKRGTP
jgi:type IV pilus assembly protein PilN